MVVVFSRIVARAEVHLEGALGLKLAVVVAFAPLGNRGILRRKISVQQMDAVEVRGVGDTGDFRSHGLILGVDDQALIRVVGTRGRLFRQLLHADQLLVDVVLSTL